MIKRELTGLAVALLAAVGSVLLLADVQLAGIVVWAVAWAYVARKMLSAAFRRRWAKQMGRFQVVRLMLLIGTMAPLVQDRARGDLFPVDGGVDQGWGAWIAVVVLAVLIRTEPFLRRLATYQGSRIANLPGMEVVSPRTLPVVGFVLTQVLALPMLLAVGVFGLSGLLWLMPAIVVVGVSAWIMVGFSARRRDSQRRREELPFVLDRLDPQFIVYWDAPRNSGYELAMWVAYLKRIGQPFFIMVRSTGCFREAEALADGSPVVMATSLKDVERLVLPSVRAAFYVNNGAKNTHLVRYIRLTHVQLLHGDSDKAASFNPVTAMFDKVFVAGQAGIDRYAANGVVIAPEKFEIVGRPQVEEIEAATGGVPSAPTVLYAPTWRGHSEEASYSSVPVIVPLFEELIARGCRIVFRPHPLSYKDAEYRDLIGQAHGLLAADNEARDTGHLYGPTAETEMSIVDCFNASDAMIADVSGVIADYLFSRKPFAIMNGGRGPAEFAAEFPLSTAGYVMSPEPGTWGVPLADLLGPDSQREVRLQARTRYLGPFPDEGYADAFLDAARRAIASGTPAPREEIVTDEEPDAVPATDGEAEGLDEDGVGEVDED